ncbi:hypothetical protein [Umezawaea sp. Da 62-37]|uniref:hypothetical protein n=1 Tax=Umezawaea sp. Da 62-37 TaxID=3075927 RepID=UPI0028F7496D|nr:hypothetical protein [Umezawaea sp. Da 62-37]WNV90814.1 hypothetical protein RM788_21795 [Umezawaea sp. Da 62-37]
MADQEIDSRGGFDVIAFVFGIGALLAAGFVLTGGDYWPDFLDLRWVVAGGAIVIGLGLLAGSVLRQRR